MAEYSTPLFTPQPLEAWVDLLVRRSRDRLAAMDPSRRGALFEEALYDERKRCPTDGPPTPHRQRLDRLAHAMVREGETEQLDAALSLIEVWVREIHGKFDPRVYRLATRVLPKAVAGLLSERPKSLYGLRH
jgi:hypothetical protein